MSAHYQILHDTHYHYDSPVSLAQQLAHLWPRPCAWQRCTAQQLQISPEPTSRRDELDVFGNPLTRLAFERPHDELLVNASLTSKCWRGRCWTSISLRPGKTPAMH
jgi:transglutaminase-like putative cysteine protease